MTIRRRLALWYSGLLALIIIIFSLAVITVSRLTILSTVDRVLTDALEDIENRTAPIAVAADNTASDLLRVAFDDDAIFNSLNFHVQIWQTHSQDDALASPQLIRTTQGTITTPFDETLVDTNTTAFNLVSIEGATSRVISSPLHDSEQNQLGVIQLSTPLGTVVQSNDQLLIITLVSAIICIGVSVALGMWLSAHLLKPIENITKAAANVADAEDLSTRLEWTGPQDELGRLTEVFNQMMGRLENLFSVQQRFIGDVSHELRTPLTSIMGNVELIERYGFDQSSLDAIHREALRMNRMVNDLLLLTRADFGELQVDFYTIDLDSIVLNVYEDMLKKFKHRKLNITLEHIDPVRMEGNGDRLRQLISNLVHNAVKFTGDGGTVSMSVFEENNQAIVVIRDTGIGIGEDDLKRIFDRFFQADTSRVQYDESDGAGLGLSIARWIVDIHGGDIAVTSTVGEGTQFRITLPLDRSHIANDKANITVITGTPLKIRSTNRQNHV